MTDKELRDAIKARIEDNTAVDVDFLLLESLTFDLVALFKAYASEERRRVLKRITDCINKEAEV